MLLLTNTVVFFALFAVWTKKDVPNFGIKMFFIFLAIMNLVAYLRP